MSSILIRPFKRNKRENIRYSIPSLRSTLLLTLVLDLQHTCLYISKPCNPTTSYLYRGNRPKGILTGCGIITCYDYQTIEYIIRVLQTSPSEALTLLLGRFNISVTVLFIILDKDYVKRSAVVNMSWCRRIWSIVSRAHMIAVTGIYYSVLGGAFCSLGKTNSIYVGSIHISFSFTRHLFIFFLSV